MDNLESEIKQRVEITDEELDSLTSAIKSKFGIDFTCYEKKSLKRGVARLIARNELGSLLGLWSKILKDREFLIKYIDDLLVNLTELFRNPEIWIKMKEDVLPKLRSKPAITVWHAGCSTGEEIYTMAIVLKEMGLLYKTKTIASDLSTTALENAKNGVYPTILWRKYITSYNKFNPTGKLESYFSINDKDAVVNANLKNHISFLRHNLAQDPMREKFDVIFCRNVMIYFDDVLKMKVLRLFYDALHDDGYFIIGFYDMLPEASKELFTLYDASSRIYRKYKVNT